MCTCRSNTLLGHSPKRLSCGKIRLNELFSCSLSVEVLFHWPVAPPHLRPRLCIFHSFFSVECRIEVASKLCFWVMLKIMKPAKNSISGTFILPWHVLHCTEHFFWTLFGELWHPSENIKLGDQSGCSFFMFHDLFVTPWLHYFQHDPFGPLTAIAWHDQWEEKNPIFPMKKGIARIMTTEKRPPPYRSHFYRLWVTSAGLECHQISPYYTPFSMPIGKTGFFPFISQPLADPPSRC